MKKFGVLFMLIAAVGFFGLVSCDDEDPVEYMYENGEYKAEAAMFSHGWKEFLIVTITNDKVTAVTVDAVSEDDPNVLKSSLTEYPIADPPGLPSVWYPILEAQFMAADIVNYDESDVDGISGATHTSDHMKEFFELILEAAKEGDTSTQIPPVYVNGDYRAEAGEFSHGWKEFMEVSIEDDALTAVNVDAISEDDPNVLKSSMTEYPMPDPPGLPSTWYPLLEAQFMAVDIINYEAADVDGITGATHTSDHMKEFFELILNAAKTGDTSVQIPAPVVE